MAEKHHCGSHVYGVAVPITAGEEEDPDTFRVWSLSGNI